MARASCAYCPDRTYQPVSRAGRARDGELVGLRVPDYAVRTFPAVASAGFTGILRVEVMTVNHRIVPDRRRRPAMMRPGFGVGAVAERVHEHVGPGGQRLRDELMPVLPRVTVPH